MLIIATAGGGIRAAYWTATILEQLERDRDLGRDRVRRHLFAISGVSGGSVGAAAYVAAIAASPGLAEPTRYLKADFLAPAVAATAFIDGPSAFLPELGQADRGFALERAWEVASAEGLARPFLSFFPSKQKLQTDAAWRPALLLNATHQDTGRRVITSHLKVERHVFLDSFDVHRLLQWDMPASAAAHNSARFTYVSPAGKLVPRSADGSRAQNPGFLLDGGYFENFGALTALQLVREARHAIHQEFGPGKVRPVILQISSDPSLTSRDRARLDREDIPLCSASGQAAFLPFQRGEWQGLRWKQRDGGGWISSFLNELTAPIGGIMASRGARHVGVAGAGVRDLHRAPVARDAVPTVAAPKRGSERAGRGQPATRGRSKPEVRPSRHVRRREASNRSALGVGAVASDPRSVPENPQAMWQPRGAETVERGVRGARRAVIAVTRHAPVRTGA